MLLGLFMPQMIGHAGNATFEKNEPAKKNGTIATAAYLSMPLVTRAGVVTGPDDRARIRIVQSTRRS
jgi:hypothetical protein